jgi:hypothetical protein
MKKEYFERCPGCNDLRYDYELPRRLRAGRIAFEPKRFEAPKYYGSWLCKRADWDVYGKSEDHCCNTWNIPHATFCCWCGTERDKNADIATDNSLKAMAKRYATNPSSRIANSMDTTIMSAAYQGVGRLYGGTKYDG